MISAEGSGRIQAAAASSRIPGSATEAAHFLDMSTPALVDAIGDVCSRFFNRAGQPVTFPCSERPLGLNLLPLIQIPV
jgi:DNA-binding transcriptional regulator LsrR (DeoR family)